MILVSNESHLAIRPRLGRCHVSSGMDLPRPLIFMSTQAARALTMCDETCGTSWFSGIHVFSRHAR